MSQALEIVRITDGLLCKVKVCYKKNYEDDFLKILMILMQEILTKLDILQWKQSLHIFKLTTV